MARVMGVDVGTHRIGVAFSDVGGRVATPHSTIEVDSIAEGAERVAEVGHDRETVTVVVGWPVRMDGSEGRMVEHVEQFLEAFHEECQRLDWEIDIERWDERLSSTEAESVLIGADLSRERRRGIVDRVAASRILQSYLDSQEDD
ncbi:MAG: Holliday junction resolvase RuvX [Bradymonadaceae bacterium]